MRRVFWNINLEIDERVEIVYAGFQTFYDLVTVET